MPAARLLDWGLCCNGQVLFVRSAGAALAERILERTKALASFTLLLSIFRQFRVLGGCGRAVRGDTSICSLALHTMPST